MCSLTTLLLLLLCTGATFQSFVESEEQEMTTESGSEDLNTNTDSEQSVTEVNSVAETVTTDEESVKTVTIIDSATEEGSGSIDIGEAEGTISETALETEAEDTNASEETTTKVESAQETGVAEESGNTDLEVGTENNSEQPTTEVISEGALEISGSGSDSGEITTEGGSAEATTESNSIATQSDETNEELGLEQTESVSQEITTESKLDAKRQTTVSTTTETDTKGDSVEITTKSDTDGDSVEIASESGTQESATEHNADNLGTESPGEKGEGSEEVTTVQIIVESEKQEITTESGSIDTDIEKSSGQTTTANNYEGSETESIETGTERVKETVATAGTEITGLLDFWITEISGLKDKIEAARLPVELPAAAVRPAPLPTLADQKIQVPAPAPLPTLADQKIQVVHPGWPRKVLGLYILLADDSEEGFESDADWNPELFDWQQEASNVLFFTFIHPDTMEIPPSYQKLAATRGTGLPGSVPARTIIMFAIGGYSYSIKPNPWHWLLTKEAAEAMAVKVAEWPEKYGCDGIDLDLEEGAGAKEEAGPNMIHFIRKLRELKPDLIISQPVYGYPQVQAETDVINASWDSKGTSANLANSLGLMVYEGTQALDYVKNYAQGGQQWPGFPITASAPTSAILLGAKGQSSFEDIQTMAKESVAQDLLGIMVWYASVKNGFDYSVTWDASTNEESIRGYKAAMSIFKDAMI